MIHLHTSKICHDDLTKAGCHLPGAANNDGWHWYAHRVTLMRKKCLVVMEDQSRYALLFIGMKKADYQNFDKLFTTRLTNESLGLLDVPQAGAHEQLRRVLTEKCSEIVCSQGLNRSVQSHIRQVAEHIEIIAYQFTGRLPETDDEVLGLSLTINNDLRKRKEDKDYFYPIEKYHDSLVAMLPSQKSVKVVKLDDYRS